MASLMSSSPPPSLLLFLLLIVISTQSWSWASSTPSPSSERSNVNGVLKNNISSLCHSTPYPDSCVASLINIGIGIGIGTGPLNDLLSVALRTLQAAIADAAKLTTLLSAHNSGIVETQRGALQDCRELHQITVSSLTNSAALLRKDSSAAMPSSLYTVRTYLSSALTNRATCLDGLATASGPAKPALFSSVLAAYAHVSNTLSIVSKPSARGRRLSAALPGWLQRRDRRLLMSSEGDEYDPGSILTVAADGSGNFTSIGEAIAMAPNNSAERTIVMVRAGVYAEHVEIPSYKTNIVLLGEGSDVTVITGNRSVGDGWTTFRSATVGQSSVSGQGFLARDIWFENTAGPGKGQAVALRVNADLVALYRCTVAGYQDTLYVHSFRQFYRECDISGTIDFVFGNAAAVFQGCNLIAREPLPGQSNVITAQSRDDPNENTGISVQNCSVVASDELANGAAGTKTFLGRPWRLYSRTVYMESYLDTIVDPAGWSKWQSGHDEALDTLYYGEYSNSGPGSATDGRVTWPGYHIMDYDEAYNFTVSEFIAGDDWLDSTSFPYDDGI